jgi:hypothetical protein
MIHPAFRWLLGGVALLLLAGRPGTLEGEDVQMSKDTSVTISARLERFDERGFVVSYRLQNRGPAAVWVFNRLFDTEPSGRYRLNPARAYVALLPEGVLCVSKRLLAVPPLISVEFPEIPCVSVLGPGESLEETLRFGFPLREVNPYQLGEPRSVTADAVAFVRLEVGYMPALEGLELLRVRDVEGRELAYPRYGEAQEAQVVLEAQLPLP